MRNIGIQRKHKSIVPFSSRFNPLRCQGSLRDIFTKIILMKLNFNP